MLIWLSMSCRPLLVNTNMTSKYIYVEGRKGYLMLKLTFLIAAIISWVLFSYGLHAGDYQVGGIQVSDPWARSTPGGSKTGAVYIRSISNSGNKKDSLISLASPVAEKVQLHRSTVKNNIAKMRHVKVMNINSGEVVSLKPGGYHIMLMGLKIKLKEGDVFPLFIEFKDVGQIKVIVNVKKIGHASKMHNQHKTVKQ
jgi:copper(I)-binding protein